MSRDTPSGVPEPPVTISRSAQEEAASFKKGTEKTEEENAPPPRTEPPAPASEGAAMAIASPASGAKTGDANHDAPSRFAPSSGPAQSDVAPAKDAKMEPPPAREGSQREPGERAIPVLPRKEQVPFLQTLKGRGMLAACAGLAIVAVALIVVLSRSRDLSGATKGHPFVNSLGMKFVPVPGTNVLFSVWETRVKDYQAFCDATGRSSWEPRFRQTADHPAVNVSWEDAKAFCEWLSEKEGKSYRLPTDYEWSCAVGIGDQENAGATPKSKDMRITDVFPWGKQWPPPNDAGNYFGEECKTAAGLAELKAAGYDVSSWPVIEGFNDGKVFTAAAGGFRPNGLGLYDLGGNVWEWCQDEYEPGSASRVSRGGSWDGSYGDGMLSSDRVSGGPSGRHGDVGFRVVAGSRR